MATTYTGPDPEELYQSLKDIVTEGLGPDSVIEQGGALLKLRIVQKKVATGKDDGVAERHEAHKEALAIVLQEALDEKMAGHPKYRRVAICLLPLDGSLDGTDLLARRTAAGWAMKSSKKAVKPNSIRTYHQPRVLWMLAGALAQMEAEQHGEMPLSMGSNKTKTADLAG